MLLDFWLEKPISYGLFIHCLSHYFHMSSWILQSKPYCKEDCVLHFCRFYSKSKHPLLFCRALLQNTEIFPGFGLTSALAGLGSPRWCHRAWSNSVARWLNHAFSFNLGVIKWTELLYASFKRRLLVCALLRIRSKISTLQQLLLDRVCFQLSIKHQNVL